jgi:hypothetical protein
VDEVPCGALDLMVLRTLDALGAQHGYGIARRLEQVAEGMLSLNQGTIYPALLRVEQKKWIKSTTSTSWRPSTSRAACRPMPRLAARRAFGAVAPMKERARDVCRLAWLEDLGRDVRYGLRTTRRQPVLTAVATLTLALGIGTNTALFSVISAVMLTPAAGTSSRRPTPLLDNWRADALTESKGG